MPKTPTATKAPPKNAKTLQSDYGKTVRSIEGRLTVPLVEISSSAKSYSSNIDFANKYVAMGKDFADIGADYSTQINDFRSKAAQDKADILARRAGVEKALSDLRSISPVPKSLASIDADYGRFCQDASTALSMILHGLEIEDDALVSVGGSNLSDAFSYLNKADKELDLKTAPAQQGKKYVDG